MATIVGPVSQAPGLPGGVLAALNVTAPAVIKAAPGIVCSVSCIVAGTLQLNDCATTGAASAANAIFSTTTMTAGQVVTLNWPCATGIVAGTVSTGTFAVSFS